MTDLVFQTQGDWDSTTLFDNGQEVLADRLYVELRAGRDDFGNPIGGGTWDGADFTAFVSPSDNPDNPWDIFPGRLTFNSPGYQVVVENLHPGVDLLNLAVILNGENVTNRIIDLVVDIDAPNDTASAYISIFKGHFFVPDEVITYTMI